MKKFNLIYVVAFIVFLILVVSLTVNFDTTVTFYGFAQNKETEISMESDVEIKDIHVTTGQKVKKGDMLLDVISSSLPMEIKKTEFKIRTVEDRSGLEDQSVPDRTE